MGVEVPLARTFNTCTLQPGTCGALRAYGVTKCHAHDWSMSCSEKTNTHLRSREEMHFEGLGLGQGLVLPAEERIEEEQEVREVTCRFF